MRMSTTVEKEFLVVYNPQENHPIDEARANAPTESDLFPPTEVAPDAGGSVGKPVQANRRKFISLLAISAVGVATVATVGGVSFAKDIDGWIHHGSDGSVANVGTGNHRDGRDKDGDGDGRDTDGDGDGTESGEGKHHHPGKTPTPQPTTAPKPTPQPTTAPKPTPQPTTAPTGTVIGQSSQATNTAMLFTNPADGKASWLVHTKSGTFVAVEAQCTHAGVQVNYNPNTGQFNCPAHGAIFNADGTNPQSPAPTPLPPVHITVNANGAITTP